MSLLYGIIELLLDFISIDDNELFPLNIRCIYVTVFIIVIII
jgi:hypothetical protein